MSSTLDSESFEIERDGEECLATFWRQATPGTTYYRCHLPAKYLPGQCLGMTPEDVAATEDEEKFFTMPRQKGAAVWQFLGDDGRARLAFGMQAMHGTRTILEVDDDYINGAPPIQGKPSGSWRKTHAEALKDGTQYSYEMHRGYVDRFDAVTCATEYLANVYREYNDNVYVCKNMIDPLDWEDLDKKDPNVLRIVWSGSTSHWYDIPVITKAMKWAARQPNVEVYYMGLMPRGGMIGKRVPWVDSLAEYRKILGRFDVGLAPIDPSFRWSLGKSDLKLLEYAMAGVAPIVAEAVPYSDWYERIPSYVVPFNEQAWLDKLKWVVKNRDEVKDYAARMYDTVLSERSIEKNIEQWRVAVDG